MKTYNTYMIDLHINWVHLFPNLLWVIADFKESNHFVMFQHILLQASRACSHALRTVSVPHWTASTCRAFTSVNNRSSIIYEQVVTTDCGNCVTSYVWGKLITEGLSHLSVADNTQLQVTHFTLNTTFKSTEKILMNRKTEEKMQPQRIRDLR